MVVTVQFSAKLSPSMLHIHGDDIKYEDNCKYKDDLKFKGNLKYEDT